MCDYWYGERTEDDYDSQTLVKLTEDDVKLIEENMAALSSQGLRVLAFATKELGDADMNDREQVESHLIFQGLIGIYDPPRESLLSR